jgi:beta-mannosidase
MTKDERPVLNLGGNNWQLGQVSQKPFAAVNDLAEVQEWLPATVPGHVHLDMLAQRRLDDPFYGLNNQASQWVDGYDWWYRRSSTLHLAPGKRAFLILNGVDYLSTIYLNGQLLGTHEGMLSRQVYEVTKLVPDTGLCELAVRLWGAEALPRRRLSLGERLWGAIAQCLQGGVEAFPDRTATLKCQMSFGWDFAPRLRSAGIWDDVALVVSGPVCIEDAWVRPQVPGGEVKAVPVTVSLTLDADRARTVQAVLTISGENCDPGPPLRLEKVLTLVPGRQTADLACTLERPLLWQPWDRGQPNLYRLEVVLQETDPPRLELDRFTTTFGLRHVAMARNPDTPPGNADWTFVLNGQREFVRGANWVPPDSFPGHITTDDYAALIRLAKEAHINLLRVWGGGLREKAAFYDLCDREGLLVWQEFPFACLNLGYFPRDTAFRQLAYQEAASIVRQLRNHPSVVLWCGGNEFSPTRNRGVVEALRQAVAENDGTRPFREASPVRGDRHNWRVWHAKAPLAEYRHDLSQFASEFGLQAAPDVASLRRFLPAEQLWPPGEGWVYHNAELAKLWRYARAFCHLPTSPLAPPRIGEGKEEGWQGESSASGESDLEAFVAATQQAQALGLQVAIDHYRRRKYRCSGVIFWQLNEPWPAICWSVLDYYRRPKLAYRRLQELYNPILVSVDYPLVEHEPGGEFRGTVWIVNDTLLRCADCLVRLFLDDDLVFTRQVTLEADAVTGAGEVTCRLPRTGPWALRAELWQAKRLLSTNHYDLHYHDPQGIGWFADLYSRLGELTLR